MELRVKLIDVKGLWKLLFAIILLYTEVSEVPNLQMEAVRPTLPSAHTGLWVLLFSNKPAGLKCCPIQYLCPGPLFFTLSQLWPQDPAHNFSPLSLNTCKYIYSIIHTIFFTWKQISECTLSWPFIAVYHVWLSSISPRFWRCF